MINKHSTQFPPLISFSFYLMIALFTACTHLPHYHQEKAAPPVKQKPKTITHSHDSDHHHVINKTKKSQSCVKHWWVVLASDRSLFAGENEFKTICRHEKSHLIKVHSKSYPFRTTIGPFTDRSEAYHHLNHCSGCGRFHKNKPMVVLMGPCDLDVIHSQCF